MSKREKNLLKKIKKTREKEENIKKSDRLFHYFSISCLVLSLLYIAYTLFQPGFPSGQDVVAHFVRAKLFQEALVQGQFPVRWTEWVWNGASLPLFNFYQVGYYYLVTFLNIFIPSFTLSMKTAILLSWWLGAFFIFLYGRRFGTIPGVAASLLYAFSPYTILDVYVRASYPEFVAINFFMGVLWSFDRLARSGKPIYILPLSLFFAITIFSHLPTLVIFSPVLAGYFLLLILNNEAIKKGIMLSILGLVLGIGIASFYLLPALLELNLVQTNLSTSGYFDFHQHFVYFSQLFDPKWGYGDSVAGPNDGMSFQVGIVNWGTILASILILIYKFFISNKKPYKTPTFPNSKLQILNSKQIQNTNLQNSKPFENYNSGHLDLFENWKLEIGNWKFLTPHLIFWLLVFIYAIYFTMDISLTFWDNLKFISFIQYPWRFLMVTILASVSIAAILTSFIKNKWQQIPILLVLLAAVYIFYGPFMKPLFFIADNQHLMDTLKWKGTKAAQTSQNYSEAISTLPQTARIFTDRDIKKWEIVRGKGDVKEQFYKYHNMSFEVKADEPLVFRINTHYFPDWEVYLDNKQTELADKYDPVGFISVKVPKGSHTIEAKFKNTPVRTVGNYITIASVLILIGLQLSLTNYANNFKIKIINFKSNQNV